jgi:molecular chaperone GrpE
VRRINFDPALRTAQRPAQNKGTRMTDHVEQNADISGQGPALDARAQHEAAAAADPNAQQVDELESLREDVESARNEASSYQDKYLRSLAEMENFKKRVERTYADLTMSSKKDLLRKLLAVRDNLERALQYGTSSEDGEGIMEGVRLTQYQLDGLLAQEGVKDIDADGKPFDPRLEEAVHSVDDPNVPDHTVVQVVRKGYTYQDEVLRPAQVVVSVHGSDEP